MKLSAPPPPESLEPNLPGEAAAPPVPPPPDTRSTARPAWFGGVDALLALLAVVFGFLAASFAARNSDLWLHLGTGRMLTTGEYRLGSDPLSFSAANRTWVNHSWLFDLGAYQLYWGDGAALVLVKALAVAAAIVLLLGIRRAGQPLGPWAVLSAVAVLAAAPRLVLQPFVGSIFFLALTLFLVFRLAASRSAWRLPVAIGVVFWFWSNVDAWFILGPVALGLLLIGKLFRRKPETADPLLPLPDTVPLALALLVGILACMLNPHHVRVWQLPFELVGTNVPDSLLQRLRMSPLSEGFWSDGQFGRGGSGPAYAVSMLAGLYAVALAGLIDRLLGYPPDMEPLPLPHTLLWSGFALLSLRSAYAIPFLAVVTVPLAASRLNVLAARLAPTRADRRGRLMLAAAGVGRVAALVGLLALCVTVWPGWLYPASANPANARRVEWAVVPDPALIRTATQFQRWREGGDLPADVHGFSASIELANYCAWFAPAEKVFLNSRFHHHRAELPDFLTLRAGLRLVNSEQTPDDAREVMTRRHLSYLAVASSRSDSATYRNNLRQSAMRDLLMSWERWSPWYLSGRALVCGWRTSPAETPPAFDRLRLDPVRLAFGANVERVPPGTAEAAPPPREWPDDFLRPVRPGNAYAEESLGWHDYQQVLYQRQAAKVSVLRRLQSLLLRNVPQPSGMPVPAAFQGNDEVAPHDIVAGETAWKAPWPEAGFSSSLSLLAIRDARRAIAENPDHPDGYYALAQALTAPNVPVPSPEREFIRIAALVQCLNRLPIPAEYRPGVYVASPTQTALELFQMYLNPLPNGINRGVSVDVPGFRELVGELLLVRGKSLQRVPLAVVQSGRLPAGSQVLDLPPSIVPLDLAQKVLERATQYAAVEPAVTLNQNREQLLQVMEEERKRLNTQHQQAMDQFREVAERSNAKLRERYRIARQVGLVGSALNMLKSLSDAELVKEFGPEAPQVLLERVALELVLGRLPEAATDLTDAKAKLEELVRQPKADPRQTQAFQVLLEQFQYQKLFQEGNYAAAGAELERLEGGAIGAALPPEIQKFHPRPFGPLALGLPPIAGFAATTNPLDELARQVLSQAVVQQFGTYKAVIAGQLERESLFFFRRGVLALLEGDMAAAKQRFQQARRSPPPGWGLQDVDATAAAQYLRLIEKAERSERK